MESTRIENAPGRRRSGSVERSRARRGRTPGAPERVAQVFSTELIEADRRHRRQELERSLQQVERAGEALRRTPGEATLFEYRQSVRRFLELALVDSYAVERHVRVDRRGSRRLHVTVERVDAALDDLVRLVLASQKDALAIAARLDDIRGLLLDIAR